MSIRTIVEINHDTLLDLIDPTTMGALLRDLKSGHIAGALSRGDPMTYGNIRVLGTRHHSETLTLKVG